MEALAIDLTFELRFESSSANECHQLNITSYFHVWNPNGGGERKKERKKEVDNRRSENMKQFGFLLVLLLLLLFRWCAAAVVYLFFSVGKSRRNSTKSKERREAEWKGRREGEEKEKRRRRKGEEKEKRRRREEREKERQKKRAKRGEAGQNRGKQGRREEKRGKPRGETEGGEKRDKRKSKYQEFLRGSLFPFSDILWSVSMAVAIKSFRHVPPLFLLFSSQKIAPFKYESLNFDDQRVCASFIQIIGDDFRRSERGEGALPFPILRAELSPVADRWRWRHFTRPPIPPPPPLPPTRFARDDITRNPICG